MLKKQKRRPEVIFACGPKPMLEGLYTDFIKKNNIPSYFSMESMMACGIGTCMGCTIKIKENHKFIYKRVCSDGPIFPAESIIWNKEK